MTYAAKRDADQLAALDPAIAAFVTQYQAPRTSTSACARQTVFFFPGGMASQLKRADAAYQEGVVQNFNYGLVWLDTNTITGVLSGGGWLDLIMHRDSAGTFRDRDDHIIIADGAVNFAGCTPHDGFAQWCANNNADLFVFPWDWRRRLDETVSFFVAKFLPYFQNKMTSLSLPDPLAKFSLVGHSLGGMVVNLILRGNDPKVANMASAITVGTPFYGYAGQVHRWFESDPILNPTGDPITTALLIQVVSSLPALYTLHFLDEATFNDSANQAALTTGDPGFPIPGYPSLDTATGVVADPYNPQSSGFKVRYPGNTGFDLGELAYAKLQFQQMAAPMAANLMQKFHNIRGVRSAADEVTPVGSTVGSVRCDWVLPIYMPIFFPSPIADGGLVPGDDTQPAWTARLATNTANPCITVAASDIEHMFMMNHAKVLAEIEKILCAPGAAVSPPATNPPKINPASREDVVRFLRWLMKHRPRKKKWPWLDDRELRKFLPPEFSKNFDGIARRMMMDIVRGPVSRAAPSRPRKNAPRPGAKKPPRKPRPRRSSKKK